MRLALVAGLLVASAAIAFACSEPETIPEESDAGDGKDAAGPTADVDSGITYAPNGCALTGTGFVSGTKAENAPRTDVPNAVSWADVEGALTEGGKFASVTLAEGQESASLRVSGFDLRVPDGKETYGIEVELKRRALDGGVEDSKIELEIEGKESRYKYVNNTWPVSIVGTHVYGQKIDTWGVDLFPADVNKPSFAAKVSAKRAAGATGPVTAVVESIRVAVYYCP